MGVEKSAKIMTRIITKIFNDLIVLEVFMESFIIHAATRVGFDRIIILALKKIFEPFTTKDCQNTNRTRRGNKTRVDINGTEIKLPEKQKYNIINSETQICICDLRRWQG